MIDVRDTCLKRKKSNKLVIITSQKGESIAQHVIVVIIKTFFREIGPQRNNHKKNLNNNH